jgi:hypothetical protein
MALHANTPWIGSNPVGSTKKVRKMNIYTPPPPESKSRVRAEQIDLDDPAAFVFASWARVIEFAPIENKPALFGMMARDAAVYADRIRADTIDGLWVVAQEIGLVKLVGATNVQAIIAVAFDRGAT